MTFNAVTAAVTETMSDIWRYADEHPEFRDTAAKMEIEWRKGLETLQ